MANDDMKKYYFAVMGIVAIVAIVAIVSGTSAFDATKYYNKDYKDGSFAAKKYAVKDAAAERDLAGKAFNALLSGPSKEVKTSVYANLVGITTLTSPKKGYESQTESQIFLATSDDKDKITFGQGSADTKQFSLLDTALKSVQMQESQGYIVKISQPSLAQKHAELSRDIENLEKSLKTSAPSTLSSIQKEIQDKKAVRESKLAEHKTALSREQSNTESSISRIVPSAKIKRKFYKSFNGFHLDINPKDAEKLTKAGYKIWPNQKVQAVLMDSVPLINADDVWKLDADGNDCAASGKECLTGKGVKIAVVDTGVDYTHTDLGGCFGTECKVIGGYDIVNNDNDPMDDHGHGTHVAAIAAGNVALKGVAPDADILAYKVLNQYGSGYWDWVIEGIERAIDPNGDGNFSDRADIISMSLGGSGDPDDPVSQAVDNAVGVGTVAVIAAGNSGPYYKTINSPGTARKAITVGASTKDDLLAGFSSRGPVVWNNQAIIKPDVVAPGVDICAAEWDGWLSDRRCIDDRHIAISGTSMATPHVAGIAALVKQAHPSWSTSEIKTSIKNSGKSIGLSVPDSGNGRVDAFNAVKQKDALPIAELEPISTTEATKIIKGRIITDDLKLWTLAYSPFVPSLPETDWKELISSSKLPASSELYKLLTKTIPDGDYIIRLLVEDSDGRKGIDYGYVIVDKLKITSPLNWDIYRAGDSIPLKLNLSQGLVQQNAVWEYGLGKEPSEWLKVIGRKSWDTSNLVTGFYTLRATLTHDGIEDQEKVLVYLDSTLKKGWPQRIQWEKCGDNCYIWGGFAEPVVSDLNGDGKEEIVLLQGGNPPKLRAYRSDGSLLWTSNVGVVPAAGGNLHIPAVGDIDKDGIKEIFAYNFDSDDISDLRLYVFDAYGKIKNGWPDNGLALPKDYQPSMLIADLDLDGKGELVIKGNDGFPEYMVIVGGNGKIMQQWSLPDNHWIAFGPIGTPAVGNFDDDKDLEIVVARPSANAGGMFDDKGNFLGWNNEGEIHVFNLDGSEVAGWPVKTQGIIFSSPAVGDLDNDSINEIVVGLMYASEIFPDERYGGLYVFDGKGNIMPGWPVMKGYNYWSSPSLADLDGNGKLEIAASRLGLQTEVYNHDGTLLSGWPQPTSWNDYYSTVIGDVNNDKKPDIITTAGNLFFGGGVYGWTSSGGLIAGFPKPTEVDAQAPAVIKDIENDGKTDIIASSDFDFDGISNRFKGRSSVYVWETDSSFEISTMHWPTFHRDVERTGLYLPPKAPPISLPDLVIPKGEVKKAGKQLSYAITLSNIGTSESGQFELQVKEQAKPPKTIRYASLKPKESRVVSGKISKLSVFFTIDPANKIKEISEGNNVLNITFLS